MPFEVKKLDVWTGAIDDRVGGLSSKLEPLAQAGVDLQFLVARRQPHVADLREAQAHVVLPPGIARIGSGQLAPDREPFLIGRKRAHPVACRQPHVAEPPEAHAQDVLPIIDDITASGIQTLLGLPGS